MSLQAGSLSHHFLQPQRGGAGFLDWEFGGEQKHQHLAGLGKEGAGGWHPSLGSGKGAGRNAFLSSPILFFLASVPIILISLSFCDSEIIVKDGREQIRQNKEGNAIFWYLKNQNMVFLKAFSLRKRKNTERK